MARIRSVKPEFFSDEKIAECSPSARLLFIGLWVFADDHGNTDRSAKQIKMRVFPADHLDPEPLIQELLAHRLLVEYSSNGHTYLNIPNFRKHQKIDRPSPPRYPKPESDDGSSSPRRALTPGSGSGSGSGSGMDNDNDLEIR